MTPPARLFATCPHTPSTQVVDMLFNYVVTVQLS